MPALSGALRGASPERRPELLELEALAEREQREEDPPRAGASSRSPGDLAYVIYTSGSTGVPKGAMVEQRGMVNHLFAKVHELDLTAAEVVAESASPCFDISVWQFLSALIVGGRVHVLEDEEATDPRRLLAAVDAFGITILEVVPSLLRMMLDDIEGRGSARPALSSLRCLVLTGEALPPELCRAWSSYYPTIPLLNAYGPTECSDDVSHHRITAPPGDDVVYMPIGRPVINTQLYVLDRSMQPAPVGVVGELYVGGTGVGRGYLRDPKRTSEAFFPDPFAERPGARLYKTGDRVRRLPGGELVFLGRVDHQVKIRGFRVEPGEIEATLRAHPAVRDTVVLALEDRPGHKRLVAYVVPAKDAPSGLPGEIRAFLKARLPAHLVPSAVVTLDGLPVSSNGKVDRRALPPPAEGDPGAEEGSQAPRTPAEIALAAIWKEVLSVERVGTTDNFFELGGDSILTIQVIARARKAGLTLTPRALLQHQTLGALAAACEAGAGASADQGPVTGPVRPSPILRWFFEQPFPEPHHWNQGLLLEVLEPLDAALLKRAAQHLADHHDALRLRFDRGPAGWEVTGREPGLEVDLVRTDLSRLPPEARPRALADAATALHASLRLDEGPLLKLGLFELGPATPPRLLLAAHHLAVDGVSWRILLEDLEGATRQLAAGAPVSLAPKTTSFQAWCERLARYADSEALAAEWPHWLAAAEAPSARLPADLPAPPEANTEGSARSVHVTLDAARTEFLLRVLPRLRGAQIEDALLAACLKALTRWTGSPSLRLDLESHGREALFEDVDPSRTVGWFTSLYPVVLRSGGNAGVTALLDAVREQLREVPRRGVGYGLLRYLSSDPRAQRLREAAPPEVSFNYLGQADAGRGGPSAFRLASEPPGGTRAPSARRGYPLEIEAFISEGQLRVGFTYSERLHRRETIERLAASFIEALEALASPAASGPRAPEPSDFPLAKLDRAALDRILAGGGEIEDVYPLSAMQRGMLFHTLHERGVAMYVDQLSCQLEGPLDVAAFQRAWSEVLARHPGLRAAILWEGLPEPVQIVRRGAEAPWEIQDAGDLPPEEQTARIAALMARARAEPLPLSAAPLMRFALIRLGPERHRFLWTHHHILFDGWSLAILLREFFICYEAARLGRTSDLPPSRPYRDFIGWLERQDPSAADAFWRRELAGFRTPTAPMDPARRAAKAGHGREQTRRVPAETTAALQALSRRLQVPQSSMLQAAWALLLSRYTGQEDVAFGITVSGRPPTLDGVEDMIGLFINTVPLRLTVPEGSSLRAWLKALQRHQTELTAFGYTPLPQIHGYSEIPRDVPLFETLLVFQNHPLHRTLGLRAGALRIAEAELQARVSFPLALDVIPGHEILIHALYDEERYGDGAVAQILDHLTHVLTQFAADVEQPPSAVTLGAAPRATPPPAAEADAGDFDFGAAGSSGTEG
jgi:amino acid adenylation domain-containing protein/non-ribosomal peptide synthase protein (TIGR01720 family)